MIEPVHDVRGSLWRVWDLHFHTPSSFDHKNKGLSSADIVKAVVDAGVSVLAVTDHHTMDLARIREMQTLGQGKLVVLPGIEVRTELGGSDSVHLVALFPENGDLDLIWDTLRVKHDLETQRKESGDQAVFAKFEKFSATVHEVGGITLVHGGSKTNSIEEIKNHSAYKQALKTGLVRDCVDMFEAASRKDAEEYESVVFPDIEMTRPVVMCSDAHTVASYVAPECWIKADPGFSGLLQVLHDPTSRVSLQRPLLLDRVESNKTRYLRSVAYTRDADSVLNEDWFHGQEVRLNPGLVAIIGNKGSGKSALAETLGLLGGCPHFGHFSFLNNKKFLKGRKASAFEARATWEDGTETSTRLDDLSTPSGEERICYIPQNYLESICNELQSQPGSGFRGQVESVVFSHVPGRERAGRETLSELIKYRTSTIAAAMELRRTRIRERNGQIVNCLEMVEPSYKSTLEDKVLRKKEEIEALSDVRPLEVVKPAESGEPKEGESTEIETTQKKVDELAAKVAASDAAVLAANNKVIALERMVRAVQTFDEQYQDLVTLWDGESERVGIPIGDVVTHGTTLKPLNEAMTVASQLVVDLEADNDASLAGSSAHDLEAAREHLAELKLVLDQPAREYQRYLDDLTKWQQRLSALVGDTATPGTLKHLEMQLAAINDVPGKIVELNALRREEVRQLFGNLEEWTDVYRKLYEPVQEFIKNHSALAAGDMQLEFDATVRDESLEDDFFKLINKNRAGSFYQNENVLKSILSEADLTSADGVLAFIDTVFEYLEHDKRPGKGEAASISVQLKDSASLKQLHDLLFSLEYLRPSYSLTWAGKGLDQLSPGEKGALLLVFYLLIDRGTIPLVIDQPEENLDNQSVYRILVPCINEARNKRQVIMVTHNPNLAVVCDADQVIRASLDVADRNRLTYLTGAIEDPDINLAALDILEGTRPAFDKRDRKYRAGAK